ncbi:MAG: VWA domain-containing protein [Thermoanaerobaculia bacterium]|nr:VWA domain-containing protein [Thermoanaerobaculia bacterium]
MPRETKRTVRTYTPLYWSFFVAALLAFGHSPAVRGQAPAAEPILQKEAPLLVAPFGAEILVSEVLLDVMVTDKKGNPILGLGPADFEVSEDDKKVQVTSATFYSNRRYAGSEPASSGASAPADNAGLAPHYFVFFFDDQRSHNVDVPGLLQRQIRAGKDAVEWLRAGLAPTDWVAVVGYDNRLKVFLDFSRDLEAIERAILAATTGRGAREAFPSRQVPPPPGAPALGPGLPTGEALGEQTGTIYEALTLVAEASAPLVGRKNLLLFTMGFGRMNRFYQYEPDPRYFEPMSESLNDANVAVYTFDLTDTGANHPFANAMSHISDDTGGRYYPNVLHFKTPIADVARETSGYYLVSYRAEHLTGLRGFQKVEVTLANPEFKVTARKGYRFGE